MKAEEVEKEFSPAIAVKKSLAPSLSVLKGAIIAIWQRSKYDQIKKKCVNLLVAIKTWDGFN